MKVYAYNLVITCDVAIAYQFLTHKLQFKLAQIVIPLFERNKEDPIKTQ